jgi:hypothetical protein
MQVSAEARWFWPGEPPRGFEKWFYNREKHPCPFGGGELRLDTYLLDRGQGEIGVKRRGGRKGVEIKGLVALSKERLHSGPFEGPIEIWTNWTSEALELPAESVIGAEKRRWLRKFDTSGTSPEEIPLNALEQPIGKRPPSGTGMQRRTDAGEPSSGRTNLVDLWVRGFWEPREC